MSDGIEMKGLKQVRKRLDKVRKDSPNAFAGALWQNAQDIQRAANPKVPVDTGTLKRAWVVDAPKIQSGTISVDVGYGTAYAIYVHERTDLGHDTGQAKFLEAAIKEESGKFLQKLAKRADKLIESGATGLKPKRKSGPDFDGRL